MKLPADNDPKAVFAFAMTFNGYVHYGSFEAAAEAAWAQKRNTVEAIRNELFFSARASRYRGDDQFLATYRELLPLLRAYLVKGP